jgi:HSP20 family molecular chaperone IbpA
VVIFLGVTTTEEDEMSGLVRRMEKLPNILKEDMFFPIQQHFDQFFNEFFKGTSILDGIKATSGFPKMDVYLDSEHFYVKASVPGMDISNIKVEILPDNVLVLSGQVSEEYRLPEDTKTYVKELRESKFSRRITLPDWIKGEPEATLKNGILKLKWQVVQQQKETSKVIEVKVLE